MSGRVLSLIAASAVPLAVLQGCSGKDEKPADQAAQEGQQQGQQVENAKPTPGASTTVSSLVEEMFKNDGKKNKTFFEDVLKGKISYVDSDDLAQAYPEHLALNVLVHHHGEGNSVDFTAVEGMYDSKELRKTFTNKKGDEMTYRPNAKLTRGVREAMIASTGNVYIVDPKVIDGSNDEARSVNAIFCSYSGKAPLKHAEDNVRKTFGDQDNKAEDHVPLPMVFISTKNCSAHDKLNNYGWAVITIKDLVVQECFDAAVATFKLVTTVIGEAQAREGQQAQNNDNRNNYQEWLEKYSEPYSEDDKEYNPWAWYQKKDDKIERHAKCGAKVREIERNAVSEELMHGYFKTFWKKMQQAHAVYVDAKYNPAKPMVPNGATRKEVFGDEEQFKTVAKNLTGKDDGTPAQVEALSQDFLGDDDYKKATFKGAYKDGKQLFYLYDKPEALYWKFKAYVVNAYSYATFTKNTCAEDRTLWGLEDDKVAGKKYETNKDYSAWLKDEPLRKAENLCGLTQKPIDLWIDQKDGINGDFMEQHPELREVMLDVAIAGDDKVKKAVDEAVEAFYQIYHLTDPELVKSIQKQVLFAPTFAHGDMAMVFLQNAEHDSTTKKNTSLGRPFVHELPDALMTVTRAADGSKTYKPLTQSPPVLSPIPQVLFKILAHEEGDHIKQKFPHFAETNAAKTRKDAGFEVEPAMPNHQYIRTTVPHTLYWSMPAKTADHATAMFLGMVKAFFKEYDNDDSMHQYYLGLKDEKRDHVERTFRSKPDNKNNIPKKIILANKAGGAKWEEVVKAAEDALAAVAPAA